MNKKTISAVMYVFSIMIFCGVISGAETETFEKGKVIEKVVCRNDATQSYALYLPTTYTKEAMIPVLFTFDPGGRGLIPTELFKPAAEAYNYIVVCPYNVKNGPNKPVMEAMRAVWNDVLSRFSVDKRRVYASGFSGGARISTFFGLVINNPVRGIIACGAGMAGGIKPEMLKNTAYFGVIGFSDFNYREMSALDTIFDELEIVHRVNYYAAPHRWTPESFCMRGIEWMELLAMKDGVIPKREAFVKSIFEKEQKLAGKRETSGEIYYAALEYANIANTFNGLLEKADMTTIEQKAAQLKDSKEFKRFQKEEKQRLETEREYLSKFQRVFVILNNTGPRDTPLRTTISELDLKPLEKAVTQKKNSYDAGMAERLLFDLGNTANSSSGEYSKKKDFERAIIFAEIAAASWKPLPAAYPTGLYNLASIYALQNKTGKALKYLKDAVDNGFNYHDYIEQDKDLNSIRNTDEYKAIIQKLK